ncbi:hypothetical protein NP603_21515 [Methylomonas sp. SURF-1]|uniref:Major tail protein n=1 Tax=Methylomonas aurea TaxID=2952224 RepID=A0ABT1UN86_9GAMM|nr:hypothetical protein [Methylomonas sp. SURF-1]MCQ8183700.1 hypothetical protein [Methylomonas sp. SURF-1]
MSLLMNKRVLIAKLETVYAADASPIGADAILLRNLNVMPLEGDVVPRDFIRPYFGASGEIRVSNYAKIDFEVELVGSGTAGQAAPWGKLLNACGFTETLLAAAVTGTAQVGGSTSSIKLAAGASAVDGAYNGATISITAGTNNGTSREIISYNGTTKIATVSKPWSSAPDATSNYSIGAMAQYAPSSSFGTNTSLTLYFNQDGVRHILLGARGTFSMDLSAKALPVMKFSFTGLLGTISDAALPSVSFAGFQEPQTVSTANTTDLNLQGFNSAILEKLTFDVANSVVYRQLVGAESVLITNRKPVGSATIEAVTVTTKDWWTSAKNAATGVFGIKHGLTPGNIISVTSQSMQITQPKYADSDGIAMFEFGMQFMPINGNDELIIVAK